MKWNFFAARRDALGPEPASAQPSAGDLDQISPLVYEIARQITGGNRRLTDLVASGENDRVRVAKTFSATYRCISLISSSIAQLPIYLQDREGFVVKDPVAAVPAPLRNITRQLFGIGTKLGGLFSPSRLMLYMASDLTTSGNAFLAKVVDGSGELIDLEYHPAWNFTSYVRTDANGRKFVEYNLHEIGGKKDATKRTMSNRQVVHAQLAPIGGIAPGGGPCGASPLEAISRSMGHANYADLFMNEYFKRGGFGGNAIISFTNSTDVLTALEIENQLSRQADSDNRRRPYSVLGGDPKVTPMPADPQGAEMARTARQASNDVAQAYGVPPNLMAIPTAAITVSSLEELTKTFVRFCLAGYRTAIESAITDDVYGDEFRFRFDASKLTAADLGAMSGFIPAVRFAAEGQEPVLNHAEVRGMMGDIPKHREEANAA